MKIALIDQPLGAFTFPPNNSVAIWMHEVGRRLARSHAVTVFARATRRQPAAERADGLEIRRLRLAGEVRGLGRLVPRLTRAVPLGPRPYASARYYLDYAVQAALAARAGRFDVIHLQNFAQFAPIMRAFNPRARIVLHMHCAWLTQLERARLARWLASVDLIVGCCDYLTEGARARFPEYAARCVTVLNGVDAAGFAAPAPDRAPAQRLVFVGRVSPEKGLHVLAEALRTVAGRYPETQLAVVGSPKQLPLDYLLSLSDDAAVRGLAAFYQNGSDQSYYGNVRGQLAAAGLADRVTFTGPVPYAGIVEQYRAADVYVQPSLSEAFPLPVLEAMAAGLPVVASRVGGIPEAVQDGQTGLLVPPGSAPALAEALLALLADQDRRRALGAAGRQRALEAYPWDVIAQELCEQYQRLA